jgi:transcription elongation factor B subunit 1
MTTFGKDATDPSIETPKDMYVKLISSDEHEFYIKRDLALTSQTIKAMLSGPGLYFI